ncbi:DUF1799 domain-containing protein [Bordetella bronchialis]|uniref:Uncharacterized protein n=1 Tax=Bordetella bronchialis TaxID=463025 RepID=A0A193FV87_9BORD|nr:DUF1799 domain-containing protein [Bordetella bronchialis]ANN71550.1 hypothetical protein BAU08_09550 [Bordetella bronchialis]
MAAFYWTPPAENALAASGLREEDFPAPVAALWPELAEPFALFVRNHTQWRVGPGGVVGLDYLVFFRELDRLPQHDQDETMDVIRLIERFALEQIYKS